MDYLSAPMPVLHGNHFCGKLFFIGLIQSPHEFDVSISCEGMAPLLISLHVT